MASKSSFFLLLTLLLFFLYSWHPCFLFPSFPFLIPSSFSKTSRFITWIGLHPRIICLWLLLLLIWTSSSFFSWWCCFLTSIVAGLIPRRSQIWSSFWWRRRWLRRRVGRQWWSTSRFWFKVDIVVRTGCHWKDIRTRWYITRIVGMICTGHRISNSCCWCWTSEKWRLRRCAGAVCFIRFFSQNKLMLKRERITAKVKWRKKKTKFSILPWITLHFFVQG